jgi:hypothetical protein
VRQKTSLKIAFKKIEASKIISLEFFTQDLKLEIFAQLKTENFFLQMSNQRMKERKNEREGGTNFDKITTLFKTSKKGSSINITEEQGLGFPLPRIS